MSLLEAIDAFVKERGADASYKPVVESLSGVVEALKKMDPQGQQLSPGKLAARLAAEKAQPKPQAEQKPAEQAEKPAEQQPTEQPKSFPDAKAQAMERYAA